MKQALQIPCIKTILVSFLTVWNLQAQGLLHVAGTYDLNGNGRSELLIIDALDAPLKYVELDAEGNHTILWQYSVAANQRVTDAKLVDLGKNGTTELVASITTLADNGKETQPWILVFPWEGESFAARPLTLNNPAGATDRYRPLNLAVHELSGNMAVALASPSRRGVLMQLDFSPDSLTLIKLDSVQPEIIRNGYGRIFTGLFNHGEKSFLAVVSPEGNVLKTSVFTIDDQPQEIAADLLVVNGARNLIGQAIMAYDENMDGIQELLLPFRTGEVLKLSLEGNTLTLVKSRFSEKGLFTIPREANATAINGILLARVEEGLYESAPAVEKAKLPLAFTIQDTLLLGDTLVHFVLLDSVSEFYSFRWMSPPPQGMIFDPPTYSLKWIPTRSNLGPTKVTYSVEIRIEEKLVSTRDNLGDRHQMTSVLSMSSDSLAIMVADTIFIQKQLKPVVFVLPRNYYVSLYSPEISESDRYVFEGEPPYSVHSVILPDSLSGGVSTTILANLNSINQDKTANFSFKSTANDPDVIVTLSLIHDLEKNLLYTTIYPPLDTIPQSFHPEDWDPDLYAYPEYFFDGYPAQMSMDSSARGINFSLPKVRAHEEGVIGLTSPLGDDHSIHIYYTGGLPHVVRGEVRVKDNGSHRIITEIDFADSFRPIRITAGFKPSQQDTVVFYPDTSRQETAKIYAPATELKPVSVELPLEEKIVEPIVETSTVQDSVETETVIEKTVSDTTAEEEPEKVNEQLPDAEEVMSVPETADTTIVSPGEEVREVVPAPQTEIDESVQLDSALKAVTSDTIIFDPDTITVVPASVSSDTLTAIPAPADTATILTPDTLNPVRSGDTLTPVDSL